MSPGVGLLTPYSVPTGGILYTMIAPGVGFLLPSSRVPGGFMDKIDVCIINQRRAIMTYNFLSPPNRFKLRDFKEFPGGYSHTSFNHNDI